MENRRNGWLWVPSLYLYQGIPYGIVMTTSALIYTNMGISIESFTFWTSLLYLPWVIKPLWSPVVEAVGTKRAWVVATQLLVAVAFALAGMSFQIDAFYPVSLALMAVIAFGSASHDIACDGFYMLGLDQKQQTFFVGIRTAFYRVAMLSALGLIPQIAESVQMATGMEPLVVDVGEAAAGRRAGNGVVRAGVGTAADTVFVDLSAMADAQLPFTVTASLVGGDADCYRIVGDSRMQFASAGAVHRLAIVSTSHTAATADIQVQFLSGNIALGWTAALAALAAFLLLLGIYNALAMPRPADNTSASGGNSLAIFADVIRSFFSKPGAAPAICFLLLYRLGESQLAKIATPFLVDSRSAGGLALSMTQYGWIYGTAGIVALTVGGIVGGWTASKFGLRKMLWPMVAFMNLPNLVYVALAHFQPVADSWTIYAAVVTEQAGYGFGFTAYMLFLLHYVGDSKYKTAEYALGTALMAIGMMLPGMVSGFVKELLGYEMFFVYVLVCCVPGTLAVKFLRLDDAGK